ncbi:helix-turn-helix domain-containing protein [Halomarina salina]|uniref:Helix-turn-helix domain-containing protein n=1 Tax=Halomarina salina TaxID=1872699 RepID=A0ABD5RRE6_9EURY|nr:helix-turn-helix domain-containing protein [Halomarina salina]
MGLLAEFHLSSDHLPLVPVATVVPETTLELDQGQPRSSGTPTLILRATGEDADALEAALDDSRFVGEYSRIGRDGATRQYQLRPAGEGPESLDELAVNRSVVERIVVVEDGWLERCRFADREEFAAYRAFCREHDIGFTLRRLHDDEAERPSERMTDRQREALLTAYEMGYFDIPRTASMADVAESLGITAPSLSERLRRAYVHLVEDHLRSNPDLMGLTG